MNLEQDGWTVLSAIAPEARCEEIGLEILEFLTDQGTIEATNGPIIGGRNLLGSWTKWTTITNHPKVIDLINEFVGPNACLVRILFFDKPPGHSWSLSLHRDRTIAVKDHHQPAAPFSKPTRKAGVPHVEATAELLSQMLTLRLHLDPMRDENGPLVVVPKSHRNLSESEEDTEIIHCNTGDLFVMRPLLLHGSRNGAPTTKLHRRVVHLEIAPSNELPTPYQWHRFERLNCSGQRSKKEV